jgi:hypothetical protein
MAIRQHVVRNGIGALVCLWWPLLDLACVQEAPSLPGEVVVVRTLLFVAGEQNFSISPDGQWLLFAEGPDSRGNVDFRLLNTRTRQVVTVEATPDRERSTSPLYDMGTWSDDATKVFIPGTHRSGFVIEIGTSTARLKPFLTAQFPVRRQPKLPVVFKKVSSREIWVVDAEDQSLVLARHAANGWLTTHLEVSFIDASADGSCVTYSIDEGRGSFAGSSRSYLLKISPRPGLWALGRSFLGPVRFDPVDQRMYGVRQGRANGKEIRTWRSPGCH